MAKITLRMWLAEKLTIVVIVLCAAWFGTMVFDREIPLTVYSAEPVDPIVEAGGDLKIDMYVLRRRPCAVFADQFMFDAQRTRFLLPDIDVRAGALKTGEDRFVYPIKTPADMAPGPARWEMYPYYECNMSQKLWPIPLDRPIVVNFVVKPRTVGSLR